MAVITLQFEGYVQCRLATDPDPTDERRGVSGYTFALPGEPDLDWIIYTQPGPGVVARPGVTGRDVGVRVTSGYCGTQPIQQGHPLFGAPIRLEGSPRFEERNYIVTQKTFGVISPFRLRVEGQGIELFRMVDFYPGKPIGFDLLRIPQKVLEPYTATFVVGYPACLPLLGPSQNPSVYRAERLQTLLKLRTTEPVYQPGTSHYSAEALAALDKRISQLRIDDPRDRRTGQLGNASTWSYALNGPASLRLGAGKPQWLNGSGDESNWTYADPSKPLDPWPCNFWMGCWDADSLTLYMSGTLQVYELGNRFEQWLPKGR